MKPARRLQQPQFGSRQGDAALRKQARRFQDRRLDLLLSPVRTAKRVERQPQFVRGPRRRGQQLPGQRAGFDDARRFRGLRRHA